MIRLLYSELGDAKQCDLDRPSMVIGRAPECDLVLIDFSISRRHARIACDDSGCTIYDLDSKNGISVNGIPVKESRLRDGDTILLGAFELRVKAEAAEEVVLSEEKGLCEGEGTIIRSVEELKALIEGEPAERGAGVSGRRDATAPGTEAPGDEVTAGAAERLELMERANRHLQILARVARTLITIEPLHELLEKVMDLVFESIPVERGFLMLYDRRNRRLVPQVVKRKNHDTDLANITISKTIAERVFRDKVSILTSDAQVDPRFKGGESIRVLGIRSAICAPLWDKEKVIGIIHCDTSIQTKAFTEDDLELLTALANYATVAIERARLNEKIHRESLVRGRLERYHSPNVINRIIHESTSEGSDRLAAREMDVSVLFADLVGFTTMAERTEPREVSERLNEFFAMMTEQVFLNEGTLDKYVGDAIMAVFGAPIAQADHARRAIDTALAMIEKLEELNRQRDEKDHFIVRVGINSGKVIAGDIGPPKRMEYTVLGDTVNVASRIESSVARPGQVVVGENTYRLVHDRYTWRRLGSVTLKGLSRKCEMFEPLGCK